MATTTVCILHPGEMGAEVGAAARAGGARVLWVSSGRGGATRDRAGAAGLEDAETLKAALAQSSIVLSVCPPHAALEVAESVAASGFSGTYLDANAVSPQTSRRIGGLVEAAGATFVDGGIIGPPPAKPGTTRLYLSGPASTDVAALFAGSPLGTVALDAPIGAASAVKACYAGWTKGAATLLLSVRALSAPRRRRGGARRGVEDLPAESLRAARPRRPAIPQGLAVDRGNGGDRRDVRASRAARRIRAGRRRSVPEARAVQGCAGDNDRRGGGCTAGEERPIEPRPA